MRIIQCSFVNGNYEERPLDSNSPTTNKGVANSGSVQPHYSALYNFFTPLRQPPSNLDKMKVSYLCNGPGQ